MQRGSDEDIGLKYTGCFGLVFHVVSSVFHLFEIICLLTSKWAYRTYRTQNKIFPSAVWWSKIRPTYRRRMLIAEVSRDDGSSFLFLYTIRSPFPTKTKILQPYSTVCMEKFVFLYFCLFVCLSVYVYTSLFLFVCVPVCIFVHLSFCTFVCLYARIPAFLFAHLPSCLPAFLPANPPACLPE